MAVIHTPANEVPFLHQLHICIIDSCHVFDTQCVGAHGAETHTGKIPSQRLPIDKENLSVKLLRWGLNCLCCSQCCVPYTVIFAKR